MTTSREAESAATAAICPAPKMALRGLHHRPDAGSVGGAGFPHNAGGVHDRAGPIDLGQQNGVRTGHRGGDQIVGAPRRVRPVDPDHHFFSAEIAFHRLGGLRPGGELGVRGNGILKVEDEGVGRECRRLGQRLGVGGGHVEDASTRAGGHDDLLTELTHLKASLLRRQRVFRHSNIGLKAEAARRPPQ